MKAKILRTDAELFIIEQYLDELSAVADVVTTESYDEDELAIAAQDADLILTCYTNISAKVIAGAPNLKGIVKYGVGTDAIDIEAATEAGVMVVNCPDYGSDTVADHAFALMISLARKIPVLDRALRDNAWVWPELEYLGVDLSGKTIGLVGFGRIGRCMSRRAEGFGMTRLVCDPYVEPESVAEFGVQFATLDDLLERADFVSIHCVLTPETTGLIDALSFERMKETAYLIDVSRGAVVDEEALIRAIDDKQIAGAGFDVFADEPLTPDYPLLGRDNVILTPHLAWWTKEAFERVELDTVTAVREILGGVRPKNLKNIDVLKIISVLVLCFFFGLAPTEAKEINHPRQYKDCMALIEKTPQAAFDKALSWRDLGGGDAAEHCLAAALIGLKHFREAATRLETLAQKAKEEASVKGGLLAQAAQAWLLAGQADRAERVLTAALKLTPDDSALYIDRAQAKAEQKNYRGAVLDLNRSIELEDRRPDAYAFRATANRFLGQFDLAITDTERALALSPKHPDALLERGILKRLRRDNAGARRDWLGVLSAAPESPAAEAARANLEKMDVKTNGNPLTQQPSARP